MARPITVLKLTAGERRELQRRVSSSTSSKRDSLRAEIVLLRSEGVKVEEVAERLNVSLPCVSKWSRRFQHAGLDGLNDKAGRATQTVGAHGDSRTNHRESDPAATGTDAMEFAQHGEGSRRLAPHGPHDLEA